MIVVVDPQHRVIDVLHRLALKEAWDICEVSDNQTVMSQLVQRPFDLIITSEKTSGLEDLELLRKIRRSRPHIRMIILTDKGTPEEVIASLRADVFSYFSMPVEEWFLVDMVRLAMTETVWDDGIEVISATPHWIRLLARCTEDTATRLIQFLRQADLPSGEKEDVATAANEILLNAMEHGGKFDPNQYVEINYLRSKRAVTCRVKDPGAGFSLQELRHAAINNPPGDLFSHIAEREQQGIRGGGFGLLLAKKLVDELIYNEQGNEAVLIKYLDAPSGMSKLLGA
jgi:anti-sigma regulatory factor (Ser/Thr protein kinase)/CheY-like chemotaxis protein